MKERVLGEHGSESRELIVHGERHRERVDVDLRSLPAAHRRCHVVRGAEGDDQAPLYAYLTKETGPAIAGDIKWNFTKFLVDKNGNVVQRFEPAVTPDSKEMTDAIEKQLK